MRRGNQRGAFEELSSAKCYTSWDDKPKRLRNLKIVFGLNYLKQPIQCSLTSFDSLDQCLCLQIDFLNNETVSLFSQTTFNHSFKYLCCRPCRVGPRDLRWPQTTGVAPSEKRSTNRRSSETEQFEDELR